MYSLRTINTQNGAESNIALGISYQLLKYEEYNADESLFNNYVALRQNRPTVPDRSFMSKDELKDYVFGTKHYATVLGDGVSVDLFNTGTNAYFIMINGNTFDNLTKK